jgi:hypothetical protein
MTVRVNFQSDVVIVCIKHKQSFLIMDGGFDFDYLIEVLHY